jgi:hypothetical protein
MNNKCLGDNTYIHYQILEPSYSQEHEPKLRAGKGIKERVNKGLGTYFVHSLIRDGANPTDEGAGKSSR